MVNAAARARSSRSASASSSPRRSQPARLRATADAAEAVADTDVSLVCVGTPSAPQRRALDRRTWSGWPRRSAPRSPTRGRRHTVVFRSTMLPGTCEALLIPLPRGGLRPARRASTSASRSTRSSCARAPACATSSTRRRPSIGELDPAQRRRGGGALRGPAGRRSSGCRSAVAEMTKYADNAFHALKVGFANEIGALCQALGRRLARGDGRLPGRPQAQHQPAPTCGPGFAFGGSCLPKDLRGLVHAARRADVSVPILAERAAVQRGASAPRVRPASTRTGKRRVGLFGLSFKPGTDDLRESPLVELAERLFGKGYDLRIYDANVRLSRLIGANRDYIEAACRTSSELLARLRRRGARARRGRASSATTRPGRRSALLARRRRPHDHRPRPPSRAPRRAGARYLGDHW